MSPSDFIEAARVPDSLREQQFGLWTIARQRADSKPFMNALAVEDFMGCKSWTYLAKQTLDTMHLEGGGQIVMDDSPRELKRHLPIWLAARGRVLNTGLGLGCVVRGLLANPEVTHIDVVEIDGGIIRAVGPEFEGNPRVTIHHADALKFPLPMYRIKPPSESGYVLDPIKWDYAWHDIHDDDGSHLHILHLDLLTRTHDYCDKGQGAWMLPRMAKRMLKGKYPLLLGAAR